MGLDVAFPVGVVSGLVGYLQIANLALMSC